MSFDKIKRLHCYQFHSRAARNHADTQIDTTVAQNRLNTSGVNRKRLFMTCRNDVCEPNNFGDIEHHMSGIRTNYSVMYSWFNNFQFAHRCSKGISLFKGSRALTALSSHRTVVQPNVTQCERTSLPVLDIAPFLDPNASLETRLNEAKKLDKTCREVGFFYIKGHGVDPAVSNGIRDVARDFFGMSKGHKESIQMQAGTGRGYQQMGRNVTQGKSDWHEAIDIFADVVRGGYFLIY